MKNSISKIAKNTLNIKETLSSLLFKMIFLNLLILLPIEIILGVFKYLKIKFSLSSARIFSSSWYFLLLFGILVLDFFSPISSSLILNSGSLMDLFFFKAKNLFFCLLFLK